MIWLNTHQMFRRFLRKALQDSYQRQHKNNTYDDNVLIDLPIISILVKNMRVRMNNDVYRTPSIIYSTKI